MNCDGCKKDVVRLRLEASKFLCFDCRGPVQVDLPSYIGQRAGNKYAPKMTEVEKRHITTRKICPDGIVRANPRYETREHGDY